MPKADVEMADIESGEDEKDKPSASSDSDSGSNRKRKIDSSDDESKSKANSDTEMSEKAESHSEKEETGNESAATNASEKEDADSDPETSGLVQTHLKDEKCKLCKEKGGVYREHEREQTWEAWYRCSSCGHRYEKEEESASEADTGSKKKKKKDSVNVLGYLTKRLDRDADTKLPDVDALSSDSSSESESATASTSSSDGEDKKKKKKEKKHKKEKKEKKERKKEKKEKKERMKKERREREEKEKRAEEKEREEKKKKEKVKREEEEKKKDQEKEKEKKKEQEKKKEAEKKAVPVAAVPQKPKEEKKVVPSTPPAPKQKEDTKKPSSFTPPITVEKKEIKKEEKKEVKKEEKKEEKKEVKKEEKKEIKKEEKKTVISSTKDTNKENTSANKPTMATTPTSDKDNVKQRAPPVTDKDEQGQQKKQKNEKDTQFRPATPISEEQMLLQLNVAHKRRLALSNSVVPQLLKTKILEDTLARTRNYLETQEPLEMFENFARAVCLLALDKNTEDNIVKAIVNLAETATAPGEKIIQQMKRQFTLWHSYGRMIALKETLSQCIAQVVDLKQRSPDQITKKEFGTLINIAHSVQVTPITALVELKIVRLDATMLTDMRTEYGKTKCNISGTGTSKTDPYLWAFHYSTKTGTFGSLPNAGKWADNGGNALPASPIARRVIVSTTWKQFLEMLYFLAHGHRWLARKFMDVAKTYDGFGEPGFKPLVTVEEFMSDNDRANLKTLYGKIRSQYQFAYNFLVKEGMKVSLHAALKDDPCAIKFISP